VSSDGGARRGFPRLALRLALVALAALLLLEGTLRFLLFSRAGWVAELGAPLRQAHLYSTRWSGREYWKLRALFAGEVSERPSPYFDARFGWLKQGIDPVTLRHQDEARLGARRPVLLYGDSFAACAVPSEDCWEGLLERSPLSAEYCLLNYGVGGYGLDQMWLLMKATLPLYLERDPIVVLGILVDDDLDRPYLALRNHPKPWFTAPEGDGLAFHPIEQETALDHVRANPVGIRSYLWRWCLIGSGLVARERAPSWTGERDHVEVKQRITSGLLAAIEAELTAAGGVPFFVLVFHGREALRAEPPYSWQEPCLVGELERRGIRFALARPYLRADAERTGTPLRDYFINEGPGFNHYQAWGNSAVFEALRAGLQESLASREATAR
jgi:hypothetical protein